MGTRLQIDSGDYILDPGLQTPAVVSLQELRLHCRHLTAWLERIEQRLMARDAGERGWFGIRLARRLEAGKLLAGARVRHRALVVCASTLAEREPGSPETAEARRCARRLSRRWRAAETGALKPGWLARYAGRVLTGLNQDLVRLQAWIRDYQDSNDTRRIQILLSSQSAPMSEREKVALMKQLLQRESDQNEQLKKVNAVMWILDALESAASSASSPSAASPSRRFEGQQRWSPATETGRADQMRASICELLLQTLEIKYTMETKYSIDWDSADALQLSDDALSSDCCFQDSARHTPASSDGHADSPASEDNAADAAAPVEGISPVSEDKHEKIRDRERVTTMHGQGDAMDSTTEAAAAPAGGDHQLWIKCSEGSDADSAEQQQQQQQQQQQPSGDARNGGRLSSGSSSSHRLAERADRHFLRRQSRQAERGSHTEDESGLEASSSQSSSDVDSERRMDLEQLWDYSCQPDLYSETDDEGNLDGELLEDWQPQWELHEHQHQHQHQQQHQQHQQTHHLNFQQGQLHQQQLQRHRHRRRHVPLLWRSPEATQLAAELTEGRRHLRLLRRAAAEAAEAAEAEAVPETAEEAGAAADELFRLAEPLVRARRLANQLPGDLLDQWERLGLELLLEEAAARARQIKCAAEEAAEAAVPTGWDRFASAAGAAARLRELDEWDARLRQWLASLSGLQARLAEAAQAAGPAGHCRCLGRRHLARSRLDGLQLMRRWLLGDRQRCAEQQHSAQQARDALQELEAMMDRCEQGLAQGRHHLRCAMALNGKQGSVGCDIGDLRSAEAKSADLVAGVGRLRRQLQLYADRLEDAGRIVMETRADSAEAEAARMRHEWRRLLHEAEAASRARLSEGRQRQPGRSQWWRAGLALFAVVAMLLLTVAAFAGRGGSCGHGSRSGAAAALLDLFRWTQPHGAPV